MNKPVIGMGATINHYTDRSPATIIDITPSGKIIYLREDKATRIDKNGMSESQEYLYEPDPEGKIYNATLRKDGHYRLAGCKALIS